MATKINDDCVFTVLPGVGHVDRRALGRRRSAGNLLDASTMNFMQHVRLTPRRPAAGASILNPVSRDPVARLCGEPALHH
jgi:hypothetical protein